MRPKECTGIPQRVVKAIRTGSTGLQKTARVAADKLMRLFEATKQLAGVVSSLRVTGGGDAEAFVESLRDRLAGTAATGTGGFAQ